MKHIALKIVGPFCFVKINNMIRIFDALEADDEGLYLWCIPYENSLLVYYIGETGRSFKTRMLEHLQGYLSGSYGLNDPSSMMRGERKRIWEGTWRGADIEYFIKNHEYFFKNMMEYIQMLRIFLLPLACENKLRKRIEGTLAKTLYEQNGIIGQFQEPDCRYALPEIPGGAIRITFDNDHPILGLPKELIL